MSTETSLAVIKKLDTEDSKTNKRVWERSSDSYFLADASQQSDQLALGVYRVQAHPQRGLFLQNTSKEFTFDYKIYGTETKFIERVVRTYHGSTGNMGVLLNGLKGTGKSVTAKLISNKMNLPVIIVSDFYEGLPKFLNDIHEDVIVFIDEYEKIYESYKTASILSVMDGVLSGKYRRLFLMTTNDLHINENMLQRPSRIYYLKTFDNIALDVINSVLDDMLDYPEFREDIIKFVGEMNIITIDLIKSIIHEVNLHAESPYDFKDIFNVRNPKNELTDLYDITNPDKPKTLATGVRIEFQFNDTNLGRRLYISSTGKSWGDMVKIIDKETAVFENREYDETVAQGDEDWDKVEAAIKAKKELKTVHRVIRREQSSSFRGMEKYIL